MTELSSRCFSLPHRKTFSMYLDMRSCLCPSFCRENLHPESEYVYGYEKICTWVLESVPAYSCLFSAFPECLSSATADKVRKLLYYLLNASHNKKIPVWHLFCLILETVNWDCFSAPEPSLPLRTAFRRRKENRLLHFLLHFLLLQFMCNMHVFELPLTEVWFQSSSDWCKLGLSASPAVSSWLNAYVVMWWWATPGSWSSAYLFSKVVGKGKTSVI